MHLNKQYINEDFDKMQYINEDLDKMRERLLDVLGTMGISASLAIALLGGGDNNEAPQDDEQHNYQQAHIRAFDKTRGQDIDSKALDNVVDDEMRMRFENRQRRANLIQEAIISQVYKNVARRLRNLNENEQLMSDEDIQNQYSDMQIAGFDIRPLRYDDGWTGTVELEFPNADNIDYDSTMVNNFICYDAEGNNIAWDKWMPNEQTQTLEELIRQKIAEKQG